MSKVASPTTPGSERSEDPDGAGVTSSAGAGARFALLRAVLSAYLVSLLAVVYFLVVAAFVPDIASAYSIRNIFAGMLPLLAVAVGQTLVMITGGIDLSVGSVISLCSVLGASVMTANGGWLAGAPPAVSVPAAIGLMVVAGVVVGLFNGAAVTLLRMPPFIVTLATMMFVTGAAVWFTRSGNIAALPAAFVRIDRGSLFGFLPCPLVIVAVLAAAAQSMLGLTLPGRWLYAVGLNARAALVSGVPVRTVTVAAYGLSGGCAAVASVLYTARLRTGSPTLGDEKLLDVVGAVVIGGTSLFGGKGGVLQTVFGVLFLSVVTNTLDWFNLGEAHTKMVKGAIILLAASFDLLRGKVLARGRT
jgi:ribose/xylose/arabinose/galactoside ABC-type transport system permease subunit